MTQPTAQPGEINGGPFDRFTLVHFASGYLAGKLGIGFWGSLAIGIGWEFVERPLKNRYPEMFPHSSQDVIMNAAVDTVAFAVGAALGRAR